MSCKIIRPSWMKYGGAGLPWSRCPGRAGSCATADLTTRILKCRHWRQTEASPTNPNIRSGLRRATGTKSPGLMVAGQDKALLFRQQPSQSNHSATRLGHRGRGKKGGELSILRVRSLGAVRLMKWTTPAQKLLSWCCQARAALGQELLDGVCNLASLLLNAGAHYHCYLTFRGTRRLQARIGPQ
ncbi:hypothetical protein VUR80DRAFT_4820 [Thermomyces stellatus]